MDAFKFAIRLVARSLRVNACTGDAHIEVACIATWSATTADMGVL